MFNYRNYLVQTIVLSLFVFPSFPLVAATYYVSIATGSDSNSGTESMPWKTIKKANSGLQAGDTVLIKKGNYQETIKPDQSGSVGKYITYARFDADTVSISGQAYGVDLGGKSYINIDGLVIHDNGVEVYIYQDGEHNIIQNCKMYNCDSYYLIKIRGGNYNKILNNDLSRGNKADPSGDIVSIGRLQEPDVVSMYNLVEGNLFYSDALNCHASLSVSGANTKYNIARNNVSYGTRRFLGIGGASRNLFEHNKAYNHGYQHSGEGTRSANNIQGNGNYNILRFNELFEYNNEGRNADAIEGMTIDCSDPGEGFEYSKIYHNTIWNNSKNGLAMYSWRVDSPPMQRNSFKNNILYNNARLSGYQIYYYFNLQNMPADIWDGNLIGDAAGPEKVVIGLLRDPTNEKFKYTLSEAKQFMPGTFLSGNIEGDPRFVDSAKHDFNLQMGSPCIDAGVFLTRTISAGSGTAIPVEDAGYFMDGWHLIEGDLIRLHGQSAALRITGVDYDKNIITVDRGVSWKESQGLSLAFEGEAPDIGAHDYKGEQGLKGDYDHDGRLSINDAIQLVRNSMHNPENQGMDFDQNGRFSVTDVIALILYIRKSGSIPTHLQQNHAALK